MIVPQYRLFQNDDCLVLEIEVPHVRVNAHSIQIYITASGSDEHDGSAFHFACLPIYSFQLNFPPEYQFHPSVYEECEESNDPSAEYDENQLSADSMRSNQRQNPLIQVLDDEGGTDSTTENSIPNNDDAVEQRKMMTYDPVIKNGTVTIQLRKAIQGPWAHLDLVGRLSAPRPTQLAHPLPSQWLHAVQDTDIPQNGPSTKDSLEEPDDEVAADCTGVHPPTNALAGRRKGENHYGFMRMFSSVFADFSRDGIAKEMLEGAGSAILVDSDSDDDESSVEEDTPGVLLSARERRRRRRAREERFQLENSKFDKDRFYGDQDHDYLMQEDCIYHCIHSHTIPHRLHWKRKRQVHPIRQAHHSTDEDSSTIANVTSALNSLEIDSASVGRSREGQSQDADSVAVSPGSVGLPARANFFTPEEAFLLSTLPYPLLPTRLTPRSDNAEGEINERKRINYCLGLGLLDLLFAYVYDYFITDGEPNVESAWNISTLSTTLSWLDDHLDDDDDPDSVGRIVASSVRRCLVYPYLRNYRLALFVWHNVIDILRYTRDDEGETEAPSHDVNQSRASSTRIRNGSHPLLNDSDAARCVIRCLLQTRQILYRSELYYLGNKLFVDPYLKWLQQNVDDVVGGRVLCTLAEELERVLPDNNEGSENVFLLSLGLPLFDDDAQEHDSAIMLGSDVKKESEICNEEWEGSRSDSSSYIGCSGSPARRSPFVDSLVPDPPLILDKEAKKQVVFDLSVEAL
jgi:SHQ1 protein